MRRSPRSAIQMDGAGGAVRDSRHRSARARRTRQPLGLRVHDAHAHQRDRDLTRAAAVFGRRGVARRRRQSGRNRLRDRRRMMIHEVMEQPPAPRGRRDDPRQRQKRRGGVPVAKQDGGILLHDESQPGGGVHASIRREGLADRGRMNDNELSDSRPPRRSPAGRADQRFAARLHSPAASWPRTHTQPRIRMRGCISLT